MTSLLTTQEVEEFVDRLVLSGCKSRRDDKAGTLIVLHGEKQVLRALQKGPGGAWIVRFLNSDRVKWSHQ